MRKVGSFAFLALLLTCIFMAVSSYLNSVGADLERDTFDAVNEQRLEAGSMELVWDEELAILAREHSLHMEESGNFEHSGLPYAENILRGVRLCSTGECVAKQWAGSWSHYSIMMDDGFTSGAVGIHGDYATFLVR